MADDVFRQNRKKVTAEEVGDEQTTGSGPLESVRSVQEAVAKETGKDMAKPFEQAPFAISGNVPPEFRSALQQKINASQQTPDDSQDDGFDSFESPPERKKPQQSKQGADAKIRVQGSDALEGLLSQLADKHSWEEFEFPSKGKFYNNIPAVVHVRAMTGEEEQILATPRWVRKGKAIDMIFRRCIKEPINTEELLSSDRTHLLIYLRGISYTPEYDVEIKCPNCSIKFAHVVDLNELEVESCPDDFGGESLTGVLPVSKFRYRYRLASGQDEQEISSYREKEYNNGAIKEKTTPCCTGRRCC